MIKSLLIGLTALASFSASAAYNCEATYDDGNGNVQKGTLTYFANNIVATQIVDRVMLVKDDGAGLVMQIIEWAAGAPDHLEATSNYPTAGRPAKVMTRNAGLDTSIVCEVK